MPAGVAQVSNWYRAGTVAVTNGGTTVTGTGTAWIANVAVSDAIHLPDGRIYEVTGISSNTTLTIDKGYLGSTATGQAYAIQPTRGVVRETYDLLNQVRTNLSGYMNGPLAGAFPDGTPALPAMTFSADVDTGVFRPGNNILGLSAGGTERMRLTTSGAQLTGLLSGSAVIDTSVDSATGKLLRLVGSSGAFGLGGTYCPQIVDLDDILTPNGFYMFNTGSGTAGTNPGFTTGALIVFQNVTTGTRAPVQIALQRSSGVGRMAWRTAQSGVFGPWQTVYGTSNAIGTVSQTGGVPTGGLFQFGTGANGAFERRASGWLECVRTDLSAANVSTAEGQLFRSANITWTFPSAFDASVKPMVNITGENEALCGYSIVSISNTAVTFRLKAATSIAGAVTVHASAIGRWSLMA
jgi:hypothetical protein